MANPIAPKIIGHEHLGDPELRNKLLYSVFKPDVTRGIAINLCDRIEQLTEERERLATANANLLEWQAALQVAFGLARLALQKAGVTDEVTERSVAHLDTLRQNGIDGGASFLAALDPPAVDDNEFGPYAAGRHPWPTGATTFA